MIQLFQRDQLLGIMTPYIEKTLGILMNLPVNTIALQVYLKPRFRYNAANSAGKTFSSLGASWLL